MSCRVALGVMAALDCLLLLVVVAAAATLEHVRDVEVSEGAPVGTRIGFIGDGASTDSGPPYLIVPVGSAVDSDLSIDQTTGEIRTKVPLDRETRSSYSLVAIPISGDNIRVLVKVLDENDNAPTFPMAVMSIEFPENTPRDVKRTLHPARDLDLDVYNTQRYHIVSGNVNNAFRLSSHRERDGVLYLDLQINGFLDRETTASYSLVIEALDGGTPPLRGEMTVNITIQDVNDNPPAFNQSRYFAVVAENATIGTNVLQVVATDADIDENGQIEYSINRRQSDKDSMFRIDATSGRIAVNKPLDFETKELHELVIVARDHGLQPIEATTFVSIRVTDVNDNQPTINVIFLSDDATAKISESAQPGEFVARISVNDPDSKTEYSNINVTLDGGDGHFGLTTRDNIIYLMIVSLPLDRETQPNYTLSVAATDTGTPPLHASRTINLQVTDINDNAPAFEQSVYHANVMEVSDPGTSVIQVVASDRDEGNNSAITYTLLGADVPDGAAHAGWFRIDAQSGLVTTRAHVDCETDPVPKLTVIATDNGFPPLSASATVLVTIHDVNDNEPIFDQSFYNGSVAENEGVGRCILKVAASDPDCGINAVVNYTIGDSYGKQEFEIRSENGEICISSTVDYETRNVYEFPVIATDRGGLSTTAMVKIQVTDVNDNRPIFYPREYNVSLREGGGSSLATTPVVVVVATDADSGRYGSVTYRIVTGNEAGLFRIDRNSGEIFVNRPSLLSTRNQPFHHLNISATDGGGLRSLTDAEVFISVIDSAQRPPIFEQNRYTFSVKEDIKQDSFIGAVKATIVNSGGRHSIRYSIYSGDPDGFFRIDPTTGSIRTARPLDREIRANVLLNIQATSGNPPAYGHTQVNIEIEDINDNAPEFESTSVRISVPENVEIGTPLYVAHARDRDFGANGIVRYHLAHSGKSSLFAIDPTLGYLTITRNLDYETAQRHSLIVTALDTGVPPLAANLSVLVEVQDVNDNRPIFEQIEYSVKVVESLAVNSQIIQVTAVDLDTGNNARLTYRFAVNNNTETLSDTQGAFGIFPNSGWIYVRSFLDRERQDWHYLLVVATDNGVPSQMSTARVIVHVLDTNDNDPRFVKDSYEFHVEENVRDGTAVGVVLAVDADEGINAVIRYSFISVNISFHINPITGKITTRGILDREAKEVYDLVVEAKDQGVPSRSSRCPITIHILDVNDNAPEIIDPQEDVVSVREEQPPNTEVVRVRAIDLDRGSNASVTYGILKTPESDGYDVFSIHPTSGVIRTKIALDHEEKTIYRLAVSATDNGNPSLQSSRMLRIEVLDLNDNRPTFTSSSLVFQVSERARIGHVVGTIASADLSDRSNMIDGDHIMYTLTSLATNQVPNAFDIDRGIGSLIVAQQLDRELQDEYRLEIRALDTSAANNPQSSAITVRIDIIDVNDNPPRWSQDPITIQAAEDVGIGASIYNFSATDADFGENGQLRYSLVQEPVNSSLFAIDAITGSLILTNHLDYETATEHTIVIKATDQAANITERLSAMVTVRIIVLDTNDNAPKFVVPTRSIIFINQEVVVGDTITQLIATDSDSGDNGYITYVISSGNDAEYFSLGYETGSLTLTKTLHFIGLDTLFTLNITASDHGLPTREAYFLLKLTIKASEESAPRLLEPKYYGSVQEDAPVGTLITKIGIKMKANDVGGNITYHLPNGIAGNTFNIHARTGEVTTEMLLDREFQEHYSVPIYVLYSGSAATADISQFEMTILFITIIDVNDHHPEFLSGACGSLSIPENSAASVVYTAIAKDIDAARNQELTYTIIGGNIGNKFTIDARTGELTAMSLDREILARYHLTIMAQDHGSPPLQGTCNLTMRVEDQNDNDPLFEKTQYAATILEDVPIDTSILKVRASDADVGVNARIIYSLANESQGLFRIDNKSGLISSTGSFDRERRKEYVFLVVASDSGKYDARSHKVSVHVQIADINDNRPLFTKYPFKQKVAAFIQPGQTILKATATDADEGSNAEIVYSLPSDRTTNKFRINPNTGILTAIQSLASESGKTVYLNVIASDKGNPPQSSTGLIEISIGEMADSQPRLLFHNSTYTVTIPENNEQFQDIVKVSAVRSDGRRQKILYSFGSGNEGNIFVINAENGAIQVRDPNYLDYEMKKEIGLVVEAVTDGNLNLHAYCDVIIKLTDQNDNAPTFTQQEYSATVWEENSKGTFVLQVFAFDADENHNSRILYHIVDGNHDNAFMIEPAFSGILKTNIVLDREIRESYRLTIIATDEGIPQMTGTTRVRINVVDVNDNQPTFPPHSVIAVSEATQVGTILTTVTANDVDTHPSLTYSLSPENGKDFLSMFTIGRFNGKVSLKRSLDFEQEQECTIKIVASDTIHTAETMLTIRITDENDNAPVFSQSFYQVAVPSTKSNSLIDVLMVNATDADSEHNAIVKYSLHDPVPGFTINDTTGLLSLNFSKLSSKTDSFLLTATATDSGKPALYSTTSIRVKLSGDIGLETQFYKKEYNVNVPENTPRGTTILQFGKPSEEQKSHFYIAEGNELKVFEIVNSAKSLILTKHIDRETLGVYTLKLRLQDHANINGTTVSVTIHVDDVNDNAPIFQQNDYEITVSEGAPLDTSVLKVTATDRDAPGTPNAQIRYDITSGNDHGWFKMDNITGLLRVSGPLDYDLDWNEVNLVIRACDLGSQFLCTLSNVKINLEDENDNAPQFPVSEYLEFVAENEPIGAAIFTARATDLDKGKYGLIKYAVAAIGSDDSYKFFNVDANSGRISSKALFDYERKNKYFFTLKASDVGGKFAMVKVRIEIESRDEFHPQFTERTYKLILATPPSGSLPVGYIVGHVTATDRDKGPDGRIIYQLTSQHPYFKINRTTGAILIKKKFNNAEALQSGKDISLVITASSGKQGSLTNMTVVEIALDPHGDPGTNMAINRGTNTVAAANGGIADWALGLLIAFLLLAIASGSIFIFLHMRNKRNKKINKPNLNTDTVSTSNNYVDPSAFDTIPIRGGVVSGSSSNQFAPPKYDEIPPYGSAHGASSNSGAATTSELSGSEQSGSSGRGSAEDGEDGEDEEIRMINEGPLQRDSGIHRQNEDDDNLSDVSVRNTQEYLARLGIVNSGSAGVPQSTSRLCNDVRGGSNKDSLHHHQGVPLDGLHIFEEHGNSDSDITNIIYAKLNDVGSERASSSVDAVGVATTNLGGTIDHVMAIGGYGDVSTVTHQPSMNGSLSSIVHSEEELAGSYNWDYLLDWGPQYQPLAHVFSEIARLKDDTASIQSAASGGSGVKSKGSLVASKTVPPPLITSVAPRSIAVPVLNSRGGSSHHIASGHNQVHMLPRSPINHDASGASFTTSAAMSPSFSPSLSPLATKSPSISPLVTPGMSTAHHVVPRQLAPNRGKTIVDAELRI